MARMKKGVNTGKNDCHMEPIKVGDTVLRNGTTLEAVVDSYGCLVFEDGSKRSPKDWDGPDFSLHKDETEMEEGLSPEGTGCEELFNEPAQIDWKGKYDELLKSYQELDDEYGELQHQYDSITISSFSATAMVRQLRSLGYEVKCTRTIVEEL